MIGVILRLAVSNQKQGRTAGELLSHGIELDGGFALGAALKLEILLEPGRDRDHCADREKHRGK